MQADVIRDLPARLVASLVDGQQVTATVVAKLTAETVQIRLGEQLIQLNSRLPLQAGQQVQLERAVENGQPVVRITPVTSEQTLPQAVLKAGQQLAVEVIRLLAENRLLVAPSLINTQKQTQPVTPNLPTVTAKLPALIEVDTHALTQTFRVGDKLALEVVRERPLAIQLKPVSLTRAELIQYYQRQVIPQIQQITENYPTLSQIRPEMPIAAPVKQQVTQLLQNLAERQTLQQPEGLRQALTNSGPFLEHRLHTGNPQVISQQDLKANLLQLAQVLRTALVQPTPEKILQNPELMQTLPKEVQTALRQVLAEPQSMRPLPALVPPALTSVGQTPLKVLVSLLSGLTTVPTGQTSQLASLIAALEVTQSQPVQGRELQQPALANQVALRVVEWQVMRDLLREVETVTARIQSNQLAMVRDPDNPTNVNVWLFDLPIKDKQQLDRLQLRLEQHTSSTDNEEEIIWQVQLNLETQNLGPMQARISLLQHDVKVVILAEREASAVLLSAHIDALNLRLNKLGLNVSHLSCRQAPVHPLSPETPPPQSDRLVDISV